MPPRVHDYLGPHRVGVGLRAVDIGERVLGSLLAHILESSQHLGITGATRVPRPVPERGQGRRGLSVFSKWLAVLGAHILTTE